MSSNLPKVTQLGIDKDKKVCQVSQPTSSELILSDFLYEFHPNPDLLILRLSVLTQLTCPKCVFSTWLWGAFLPIPLLITHFLLL